MTDIVTVATAVQTALSSYYSATLEYSPEFTLAEAVTQRVVVVPTSTSATIEARGKKTSAHTVQVALVKRITTNSSIGSMVTQLQTIGGLLLGGTFGGCVCTGLAYPTLYGSAELREKRLYVGVVELTLAGD